ncbi:transcription termination factor Rho [Bifidobacterium callimiconis]|uniref:transcription termination factor Rho n=1 Tax=Bifidobacterium callimiconis TaxID=2306973 RepID=UPI000F7EF79B|nr:transcription termination factor Rho [Bifidobacterium callimiconis]MBT1177190.1 transcription termination factor Rho [Bifidobacterium callimiconis]
MAESQNLASMKLPELKELAKQMGLRGTSTMRKGELVSTIEAARNGGEAPAGVTVRVPKTTKRTVKKADKPEEAAEAVADVPSDSAAAPVAEPSKPAESNVSAPVEQTSAQPTIIELPEPKKTVEPADHIDHVEKSAAKLAAIELPEPKAGKRAPRRRATLSSAPAIDNERADRADRAGRDRDHDHENVGKLDLDLDLPRVRRRKDSGAAADEPARQGRVRDLGDILAALPDRSDRPEPRKGGKNRRDDHADRRVRDDRGHGADRADRYEQDDDRDYRRNRADRDARRGVRDDRNDRRNGADRNDRRNRRDDVVRADRADRAERNDYQQQDDLVPVAGIVDVLESYAFVRTSGYLPGPNDVYVSMGQVKKYGLRKGDAVQGTTRPPRDGRNQRQKFVPLQSIETINGMSVEEAQSRPHFSKLTPLYPQERLRMETQPTKLTGRLIDIVAPIGKGQRGLIVSPPKAGKTITLQQIANSITTNNPEVHLMVVLVDERPEEVTDMERTVQGEVISSTFDRPASDHTIVAELAIERAKRLVELGKDVVVLLDSMTRLARAYNIAQPASGRILSGGVDAQALYPPKKFFGAARNIENGGSLTIISSALVETGSKMDEVIFEEFKGTGNMELRLSRELSEKRLFPAIDINASGTRREELITPPAELAVIYRLRRLFGGMEPEQAYQTLVPRLKKTATNREFLAAINSTIPQAQAK